MMVAWSDDARVMLRPFATYRELAARPGARPWLGPLRWSLVIACLVSLTTAGKLLADHLLLAPLAWAFAPLSQTLWIVLVARMFRVRIGPGKVVALYFAGHAPWFMVLVSIAGVCLLAPSPWAAMQWLLRTRVALAVPLVATAWCGVLTYAMFRSALGLGRGASLLASAAFYVGYGGTLVSYFLATGQLLPLFGVYW
jgi:hypothetical protein